MSLTWRQRTLAVSAFVTALGTGYVANLDEAGLATGVDPEELVSTPSRRGHTGRDAAPGPGRGASLARGDWPEAPADAQRAWGQELPLRVEAQPGVPAPGAGGLPTRSRTVAVAPTPPRVDSEPVAEVPPPWRLIGRLDDAGTPRALLATAQQLQVVAGGDTLDGRWRVERVESDAVELRALAGGQAWRLAWDAR
jgi:hypothetical protein